MENSNLTVIPAAPQAATLMAAADAVNAVVVGIKIDSQMMYEYAAVELVDLAEKRKALEEQRFAITRPMDTSKANTIALFKPALERMDKAIAALKAEMLTFAQAEKAKQAAAQKLLDEQAEAERKRVEQTRVAQAAEAEKQSKIAADLMSAGTTEGVSEALDAAENAQSMAATLAQVGSVISAPTVAIGVRRVAGVGLSGSWKARITDPHALIKYLAEHPEYIDHWVEFSATALNNLAKAQRDAMRIPGVEAYEDESIRARGGRKAA